ncbi:MAG: PAS domain-containing protein [Pseudomonadota bacterium]
MLARTSRHLYRYWNELRGQRRAPRRFDIEPVRISRELPDTFILEEFGSGAFRFRLAGTRVMSAFGSDLRGQTFNDIWSVESLAVLNRVVGEVYRDANVAVVSFSAGVAAGTPVTGELVLLPLLHSDDQLSRILGGMTITTDGPWVRPAKADRTGETDSAIAPLGKLTVTSVGMFWPDAMTMLPGTLDADASPSELPILRPELLNARIVRAERRAFRIVEGGRVNDGA